MKICFLCRGVFVRLLAWMLVRCGERLGGGGGHSARAGVAERDGGQKAREDAAGAPRRERRRNQDNQKPHLDDHGGCEVASPPQVHLAREAVDRLDVDQKLLGFEFWAEKAYASGGELARARAGERAAQTGREKKGQSRADNAPRRRRPMLTGRLTHPCAPLPWPGGTGAPGGGGR